MKKLFVTITLLFALVGSVFAVDWKEYKTGKDESGEYKVYFDFDATEPFELEKDVRYIMNIQLYYDVEYIILSKYYDDEIYSEGVKHNFYSTLLLYEDTVLEYHVNNDGTCTIYCYGRKGRTIDDITIYSTIDAFEEPWVRVEE